MRGKYAADKLHSMKRSAGWRLLRRRKPSLIRSMAWMVTTDTKMVVLIGGSIAASKVEVVVGEVGEEAMDAYRSLLRQQSWAMGSTSSTWRRYGTHTNAMKLVGMRQLSAED